MDTLGIVVIVLIDDTDLGSEISVCGDVVSTCNSLVGVCEAHLEDISESAGKVVGIREDDGGVRSGRGDREDLVLCIGRGNRCAGSGSNSCKGNLHTPVLQNAVSGDCLLGIVCVVLHIELELNSALGVDFFDSDLSSILDCLSVNSCGACQRAGTADLDLGACICALCSIGRRTVVSSRAVVSRCTLLSCCTVVGRCCALSAA